MSILFIAADISSVFFFFFLNEDSFLRWFCYLQNSDYFLLVFLMAADRKVVAINMSGSTDCLKLKCLWEEESDGIQIKHGSYLGKEN